MWIFYQIKRVFFIIKRDSFFYLKENVFKKLLKIYKKNNFLKKTGIPILNRDIEIKLEEKEYSFYNLQPIDNRPFYINSPLFIILEKHKIDILNNLVKIFDGLYDKFKLKMGLEIEFYILNNKNNNIIKDLKKILTNIENIEREQGENQFEIKTKTYIDINLLINDYFEILKNLNDYSQKNNLNIDFSPLPFDNDSSSSLQVNISLVENSPKEPKEQINLFARKVVNKELCESDLMLNCVAGLLKNINNNLLFFIKNKDCLKRFNLERNIKIKCNSKYPAPTFVSWGINNRSASIRIPTPNKIEIKNYMAEDNKNRRIEYRIPSSNADIYLVLIGIIISLIEGLENNLFPKVEKTSFDILISNDGLEKIETDFEIVNNNFSINEDVLFF